MIRIQASLLASFYGREPQKVFPDGPEVWPLIADCD